MDSRTYRKEEIQQLLERAAELQAKSPARSPDMGLTLEELEQVAATSGLDPVYLRKAAEEMEAPKNEAPSPTATHIFAQRWVDGELTDEAWHDVLVELRQRYDTSMGELWGMAGYGKGSVEQHGSTRSWTHTSTSGLETQVHVSPRGKRTHIRLSQRIGLGSPMVQALMYGAFATFVLGSLATSAAGGIDAVAVVLGIFVVASFLIYQLDLWWRRSKQRELDDLAERLAGIVRQHAPVPKGHLERESHAPTLASSDRSAPEIDLDEGAPEETTDPASHPSPQRQRKRGA